MKLGSNLLVLAILGVGYWSIAASLKGLAVVEKIVDHEFSLDRRLADEHFNNKNWTEAGRHFRSLTESDPANGGAQVSYAFCLTQQMEPLLNRLRREFRMETPDPLIIDQAMNEIRPLAIEAIPAYERTLEFIQFRNFARWRLALLHGLLGDADAAIKYLKLARRDEFEFPHRGSISDFVEFRNLLGHPPFQQFMESL
jgi:tetratricopeptide (TPR) repeat protein